MTRRWSKLLLEHVTRDKLYEFINAKTTANGTASLHIAAKNGSLDIVKSLLAYGASYNIKNKEGKAPIDVSNNQDINSLIRLIEKLFKDTKNGNVKVIETIEALQPDEFLAATNARNHLGSTLLQVAIFKKRKYITSKIIKTYGKLRCRNDNIKERKSITLLLVIYLKKKYYSISYYILLLYYSILYTLYVR